MTVVYIVLLLILGLMFGSFFCCIGYRIPNKISIVKPGSHCTECKKELKWYMNIPVLSFLFLKGRCGYCNTKLSLIYPLIEIATAILFVLSYLIFGISFEFIVMIVLSSVLIVTIVSDFKYYYISDRVLLSGVLIILVASFVLKDIKTTLFMVLSALCMFLVMFLVKKIGDKLFKKESMGGGDIKLMALIGASVGIILSMCSVVVASFIALPYALMVQKKNPEGIVPFGPFLLVGAILMLIFKNQVLDFFSIIY